MKRSQFNQLLSQPDYFFWATGIEDTFITEPWPATGRTLDEYELTQHYTRWKEDLGLMSELGVTHARYGIPWHRINPARNTWDWEFADKTLDRLLDLGIDPIVDLVHYGLPRWIEKAYLHPDFSKYMAEYASRAAERFKGRIHLWTPLNEPRVTAWYCGKLGWWPPFGRGWRGFLQVMVGVCRGMVATTQALQAVDNENMAVHVDATDLYESSDPSLAEEVFRRQEIVFLALDLITGAVTPKHSLYSWLILHGVSDNDLQWFQENAITLDLIGINLYPLFSLKILSRSPHLRMKMPYASAEIVERLARLYYARYQVPLFISETASLGSVNKRAAWLTDSMEYTRRARANGVPLMGYTWWPLFALVTWAYRQGKNPPEYYIKQMGLWDLKPDESAGLQRIPTSLVEQYQKLISNTATHLGQVNDYGAKERMHHVS
ncbi:MAG: glycosyl hydrolase family protein [Verrucomicrobiales bacterium]|nr:glycosyl hydrolase family protein [Verrucomicrobiales bacterium]